MANEKNRLNQRQNHPHAPVLVQSFLHSLVQDRALFPLYTPDCALIGALPLTYLPSSAAEPIGTLFALERRAARKVSMLIESNGSFRIVFRDWEKCSLPFTPVCDRITVFSLPYIAGTHVIEFDFRAFAEKESTQKNIEAEKIPFPA